MTSLDLGVELPKFSETVTLAFESTHKTLKCLNRLHRVETTMIVLPRSRVSVNNEQDHYSVV
jgi:hypothetical protein